jgi:hypothetical protein
MSIHIGARLHAFVHGLFRPSDETETRELYQKVERFFDRHDMRGEAGRRNLITLIAEDIVSEFDLPFDHPQFQRVETLVERIFYYEGLFLLPRVNWSDTHSVTDYWEIRDRLNEQRRLMEDFDDTCSCLGWSVARCLDAIYTACPALLDTPGGKGGIIVPTTLMRGMSAPGDVAETIIASLFVDEMDETGLFNRHRKRLDRNIIEASGGNPADPKSFNRTLKLPRKSDIKDPAELVETYLGGTPIVDFFDQKINFTIPQSARFEHHHIVAGSGHGKTQTLQYLIGNDLPAVAEGRASVIVLDSQGDLIRNIANLAEFAPGGPLHDRIVIIDPTDVEWPVSLNLFDVGIERLKDYAPLERERLTNSILELYDFVLGSLLSAEMTQKQNVIFRYVTRLMLHIPDATIHTLRELMEPDSQIKFAAHIAKLEGTARHFFETEFASKEFGQTKKQVLRRLWGILENQTFERMFSHPRSKLDLFAEMNAGKIILINTAKDLLKEQGTEIFGRFFIAMIAQAAQERATLPENKRMPTFVYIDEAADYFDRNIGIILSQARKYGVGMILAHQYLGQLEPKLLEAFSANTSIKFAGGVSARDAKSLAPMLYCDASLIEAQPKGHFAAHVRGVTKAALPLEFPFGFLENKPHMSREERRVMQDIMRQRYAVHYTVLNKTPDEKLSEVPDNNIPPPKGDGRRNGPDDIDTDPKPQW